MKRIFSILLVIVLFTAITTAQWTEQTSGQTTQLSTVSAVDDNNAWICGFGGKVLRTTNGGTTWTLVSSPGAADLYNIFGVDANTALTTSSPAATFVYRTTNGGANWTQVFTQTGGFIDAIWMTSSTNGFMMGDPVSARWSLWKTTNGGANWDSTGLFLPANGAEAGWNNGMFASGNNIWFNTNAVRFYYSSNSGSNFVAQTVPGFATFGTIWFNSATAGMGSYGNFLIGTTNSGTTWSPLTLTGTATINGITGSGTTWFACRAATIIYKSTNAGTTWTTDYTAPAGNYTHMNKAINGNRLWAVRSNGGISVSNQLIGITPISGEVPNSFSLSQNYPNPFNPSTNITFSVPSSGRYSLKVFNILGQEIAELFDKELHAGTHAVGFEGSGVPSGTYIYTLTGEHAQLSKAMMLIK